MWVCAPMSGERPSPRVFGRTHPTSWRTAAIMLVASAAMAMLLLSVLLGPTAPVNARATPARGASGDLAQPVAAASWTLVNLTANNTTVDVSMNFNISVDVVNLTGGALNTSNFTYVWTGLPAFVPGTPGSGCYGANPGNNSSVLNCTAASSGTLKVSVTATNFTGASNSSSTLSIVVNPLPTISVFHVSATNSTLGTQIWFNATAAGGTAPITFSYSGLPLGCAGSSASFSCTPTRAGLYKVTVAAVDSYGFSSATQSLNVTVKTVTKTSSPGIGTTGWAVVIGIVVVGAIATLALLLQARREERAGRMGMEEAQAGLPEETGGQPPMGGSPPSGPPT
jgi:hypothetical protein